MFAACWASANEGGQRYARKKNAPTGFPQEGAINSSANCTRSTSTNRLAKRWQLGADGHACKEGAGLMTEGEAMPLAITKPSELAALINGLSQQQALGFGVPHGQPHAIVTQDKLDKGAAPGAIARTRKHFYWPKGAGWLMLDYDPPANGKALAPEALRQTLYTACPALQAAPHVWSASSSSCIVNRDTGEPVTGMQGQRLYLLVQDARDIARSGAALYDLLWLAGHGRYDLSKAGSLLERTLVDSAVWQPERLDFAAPPVCVAPLMQQRPAPQVFNDDAAPLDTRAALPGLTPEQQRQLADTKKAARADGTLLQEQHGIREAWIGERMAQLPSETPEGERAKHEATLRAAVTKSRLFGNYVVKHSSGQEVTVGQLLDNPDQWHNQRFYDPLEPDQDKRVAWLNLHTGGRPILYSHKHGGRTFQLFRAVQEHQLTAGDKAGSVEAMLERLRIEGEVYERGGELVRVADGELVKVEQHWLANRLEGAFRFMRFDGRSGEWKPTDCPTDLAQRVMAARGQWRLPKLTGMVQFAVMRPDGTVLERPGFDKQTGLLWLSDQPDPLKPRVLSAEELPKVLAWLWQPWKDFPFDSALSRGVWMAALLTTVCRPALPTAPGFLIRAYSPGTGKSLLSACLMRLVGAPIAAMSLGEASAEESEKRIASKLMSGAAGALFDNLEGSFRSTLLCAALTAEEPELRPLGVSRLVRVPNRAMFVLNGNNVTPGGDLFRRVLPITLDAGCENPERRSFDTNPQTWLEEGDTLHWYRNALLSVLLTFAAEGFPRVGAGSLGSFNDWERLIRQCVCWLAGIGAAPVPIADPLEVLELAKAEDPAHQRHAAMLEAWHEALGGRAVHVKELAQMAANAGTFASFGTGTPEQDRLGELLKEVGTPFGKREVDSRYLAGWLTRSKGRVVDGKRLVIAQTNSKHGHRWSVERVTAA